MIKRQVEALGDPPELFQVLADHDHAVVGPVVAVEEDGDELILERVFAGDPELLAPLGQGVFHPQRGGKPEPNFVALGFGDPSLGFEHSPGDVVFLGPDQAEDVFLAVVFANQGRGQAEAAAGLNVGRDAEDRGRQQVNLVVDDQAPVALVEEMKMGEIAVFLGPIGDDLVGRQRDRRHRLRVAGVGADQRGVDVGLVEDLALPLLDGGRAGGEDQGLGLERRHRGQADDRLAGAAGQDDHSRAASCVAAGVKGVDGPFLVVANLETAGPIASRTCSAERQGGAGGVAGEVLGRVTGRDQGLLEDAAVGVVDGEAGLVDPGAQVIAHAALAGELFEQGPILGRQAKLAVLRARAAPGRSG